MSSYVAEQFGVMNNMIIIFGTKGQGAMKKQ